MVVKATACISLQLFSALVLCYINWMEKADPDKAFKMLFISLVRDCYVFITVVKSSRAL